MDIKYTNKNPNNTLRKTYASYVKISNSEMAVGNIDAFFTQKVLSTKFKTFCRSKNCCIGQLGQYKNQQIIDECDCRLKFSECGELCYCQTNKEKCTNRSLQNKKMLNLGNLGNLGDLDNLGKLETIIIRGIDQFTKAKIDEILKDFLEEEKRVFFVQKVVLKNLQRCCSVRENDTTLMGCFRKCVDLCNKAKNSEKLAKFLMENSIDISCNKEFGCDKKLWGDLKNAAEKLVSAAEENAEYFQSFCKGEGLIVKKHCSIKPNELIGEYVGEIYPPWRWFEREKNLKYIRKRVMKLEPDKLILPEFYNMVLERNENDPDGYGLVVVDAKNKGNIISRASHSCEPNAKVIAVAADGEYHIGMYALKPIGPREEVTFDYLCRTDSHSELKEAVCLCGAENCRGSFLIYSEDFSGLLFNKMHNIYERFAILLKSSMAFSLKPEDVEALDKIKIGPCLLEDLPLWAKKFAAEICLFIEKEQQLLPKAIFRKMSESKTDIDAAETEKLRALAEDEALFIKNKRVQSLATALDKLSHFLRHRNQPDSPPLQLAPPDLIVKRLWTDPDSLVNVLRSVSSQHLGDFHKDQLANLVQSLPEVESSLTGLNRIRERLSAIANLMRTVPELTETSHLGAADVLELYSKTKVFFFCTKYKPLKSAYAEVGVGVHREGNAVIEHSIYSDDYPLVTLCNWHKDAEAEPEFLLHSQLRGAVLLPDISSCYVEPGESLSPPFAVESRQRLLGRLHHFLPLKFFFQIDSKRGPFWPRETHFRFSNLSGLFGSPFFDGVLGLKGDRRLLKRLFRLGKGLETN